MHITQKSFPISLAMVTVLTFATSLRAMDMNEAGKVLGQVRRDFQSGKTEQANAQLSLVEAAILQAQQGGADMQAKAKMLEGQARQLRTQIDRKLGGGTGTSPTTPVASSTPEATALPHGAATRIREARRYAESAREGIGGATELAAKVADPNDERLFRSALRNVQGSLVGVRETLGDLDKRYPNQYPSDHPDVVFSRTTLAEIDPQVAALQAKADGIKAVVAAAAGQAEQASAEWIAKLEPYTIGLGQAGYDAERYFVGSYTAETDEMTRRSRIYVRVKADYDAYCKSAAAQAPNEQLQRTVRDIEYNLKTFVQSTEQGARNRLEEANATLDRAITRMNEEARKIGTGQLPNPTTDTEFENARRNLDLAAHILPKEDPALREAEAKYVALGEGNAKLRQARVSETRMARDRFKGGDANQLKQHAERVALAAHPDGRVLRTVITSEDWREESVVEWTDTTRSALQHRITRAVTSQVATRVGNDCRILTVFLSKNRNSDGNWTPLTGHVMFEDPILEANVAK
jgi:hypothetical protein